MDALALVIWSMALGVIAALAVARLADLVAPGSRRRRRMRPEPCDLFPMIPRQDLLQALAVPDPA